MSWGTARPAADATTAVIAALARGELVALPTETVYGLAARADDARAVAHLAGIKGRRRTQPLTWHVAANDALARFPRVSPLATRLIERYWPGPLTLVLPGRASGVDAAWHDGWSGVRRPAHAACEAVLARAPFPIVATSANVHGEHPLNSAAEILAAFGDELAYVIDGGIPRLGEASVVLKLGPGHFELLREGIVDLAALRATAGLRIGFVCTGNTCRSPMAEGLARDALAQRLAVAPARLAEFGFELTSMGVYASSGARASEHAVSVLAAVGIDISQHRSRAALPESIAKLDRVYALTASHLEALTQGLPPGKARHCALLDPTGADVLDPIGEARGEYERTAAQIRRAVERRLDEWA